MFVTGAVDYDRVLPRCVAAVHHGGAGTTHAALRAGVPSLVCSAISDQAFWGWRVAQLGVGTTRTFQKLDEAGLRSGLEPLLRADVRARAQALGEQLRQEDGASRAAQLIEQLPGAKAPVQAVALRP